MNKERFSEKIAQAKEYLEAKPQKMKASARKKLNAAGDHIKRRWKLYTPLAALAIAHIMIMRIDALTTDSVEDYMKDNNIPKELVSDIGTDNIRVYHDTWLAAYRHANKRFSLKTGNSKIKRLQKIRKRGLENPETITENNLKSYKDVGLSRKEAEIDSTNTRILDRAFRKSAGNVELEKLSAQLDSLKPIEIEKIKNDSVAMQELALKEIKHRMWKDSVKLAKAKTPFEKYKDNFENVVTPSGSLNTYSGEETQYIIMPKRENELESLGTWTGGIPVEDLNVSKDALDSSYWGTLVHELWHQVPDTTTYKRPNWSITDKSQKYTVSGEITSDFGEINALERLGTGRSNLTRAQRAIQAFMYNGGDHNTTYYINSMLKLPKDKWPDLWLLDKQKKQPALYPLVKRYGFYMNTEQYKSGAYKTHPYGMYMAILQATKNLEECMENSELYEYSMEEEILLDQMKSFIWSMEYIVKPEKIKELKARKDEIDRQCKIEQYAEPESNQQPTEEIHFTNG